MKNTQANRAVMSAVIEELDNNEFSRIYDLVLNLVVWKRMYFDEIAKNKKSVKREAKK